MNSSSTKREKLESQSKDKGVSQQNSQNSKFSQTTLYFNLNSKQDLQISLNHHSSSSYNQEEIKLGPSKADQKRIKRNIQEFVSSISQYHFSDNDDSYDPSELDQNHNSSKSQEDQEEEEEEPEESLTNGEDQKDFLSEDLQKQSEGYFQMIEDNILEENVPMIKKILKFGTAIKSKKNGKKENKKNSYHFLV